MPLSFTVPSVICFIVFATFLVPVFATFLVPVFMPIIKNMLYHARYRMS